MATLLRDTAVRQAKPKKRKYYLGDGDNLRIMIHPNGSKVGRRVLISNLLVRRAGPRTLALVVGCSRGRSFVNGP